MIKRKLMVWAIFVVVMTIATIWGCMGIRGPSNVGEGTTTQYTLYRPAGETTWTTTAGEIDSTGTLTAPRVFGATTIKIMAQSGAVSYVKIVAILNTIRDVVSLEVEGPDEVNEGSTTQYHAWATYDDGGREDVTNDVEWSVEYTTQQ